jgi:hypothetical protein
MSLLTVVASSLAISERMSQNAFSRRMLVTDPLSRNEWERPINGVCCEEEQVSELIVCREEEQVSELMRSMLR